MVFRHKIVAFVPLKRVIGKTSKNLIPVISSKQPTKLHMLFSTTKQKNKSRKLISAHTKEGNDLIVDIITRDYPFKAHLILSVEIASSLIHTPQSFPLSQPCQVITNINRTCLVSK
jgi:hypothetical protein